MRKHVGTENGYSVLDIGIDPRRLSDIATGYANPEKAYKDLGFKAEKTLEDKIKDSWKFLQTSKSIITIKYNFSNR